MSKTSSIEVLPISGSRVLDSNMTVIKFGDNLYIHDSGKGMGEVEGNKRILTPTFLSKTPQKIPDFKILDPYLKEGCRVSAVIITHMHADHTGSLKDLRVYLSQKDQDPVFYCSKEVAICLKYLKQKIPEQMIKTLKEYEPFLTKENVHLKPIPVNHSTIGTMGIYYEYQGKNLLYLPDFCVDYEPGWGPDQSRIESEFHRLGKKGVDGVVCESTLATEGFESLEIPPKSEAQVCSRLRSCLRYYHKKKAGIIVSGFATNAVRTCEAIKETLALGRRVGVLGSNLKNLIDSYFILGLLPSSDRDKIEDVSKPPALYEVKRSYVIITSGHQGEALAGLTRIASDLVPYKIGSNDVVLLCSKTIPKIGPIISRGDMLNNLRMRRVLVIEQGLHKSGHIDGGQLVHILKLLKPKKLIANHGDYEKMLGWHRVVALGSPETELTIGSNGISLLI